MKKAIYFYSVKGTAKVFPILATKEDYKTLGACLPSNCTPGSSIMEVELGTLEDPLGGAEDLPCKLCGSKSEGYGRLDHTELVSCSNTECTLSLVEFLVEEWIKLNS